MAISFHLETPITLKNRKYLKEFLTGIFMAERKQLDSLSYVFCTDEYLLGINRKFLNHDYYTDIITFDLGEGKSMPVTGEIYISVDRVKENAQTLNISLEKELQRVIIHGVLHLCGYKDKSKLQKIQMRQKEDYYLEKL